MKALLHVRGNFGERHPDPPLVLLEHLRELLRPCVEHDAGAGQPHAAQPGVVGQVRDRAVVELDDVGDVDRRILDRLVLAELPVGDVQVAEVHAAELRHDRRQTASGSSIAVAIRSSMLRSSMSKALRMWAQPARSSVTTSCWSWTGSNSVLIVSGADRDLAERQGGRENLDEEGFHRDRDLAGRSRES